MQLLFGIVCLLVGLFFLGRSFFRGQNEGAERPAGVFGRLGGIMVGLVLAFLGAALLLPARNAEPVGGANQNPVDEAVEDGSTDGNTEGSSEEGAGDSGAGGGN